MPAQNLGLPPRALKLWAGLNDEPYWYSIFYHWAGSICSRYFCVPWESELWCLPCPSSTSLKKFVAIMAFSIVWLAIIALGCAKSLVLEHDLGGGHIRESEDSGFRLRSRDSLRQGYKLAVHDVKPFARAAVDQGKASPFKIFLRTIFGGLKYEHWSRAEDICLQRHLN